MLKCSAAATGACWGRKYREMGASHELSTHVSHPRARLCVHMQSSLPGRMHKGALPALPETPLTKTTLVLTGEDGEMAHRGVSPARKTNPSAKPHRGLRAEKKGTSTTPEHGAKKNTPAEGANPEKCAVRVACVSEEEQNDKCKGKGEVIWGGKWEEGLRQGHHRAQLLFWKHLSLHGTSEALTAHCTPKATAPSPRDGHRLTSSDHGERQHVGGLGALRPSSVFLSETCFVFYSDLRFRDAQC